MYHYLIHGDYGVLRNEVQDFFDHWAWKVSDIPDPKDGDEERYGTLKGIVELLAHGFNRRIRIEGKTRRGKEVGEWEVAARSFFCGTRHLPYMERLERVPKWVLRDERWKSVEKGMGGLGQRGFGAVGTSPRQIVECFI
ncbi:hypothetical protein BDW02DRAFT_604488 [Decorospora gaudefroyi]|uniref:Uncharacterized protein n=1 Tax=Decorospora gaudefroyi TaxID=184978 RepID=A0A6A5KQ35_9PLEO|nr:hypothetical protein BDW02DRAFT_604488 [Decorospora gaudefroyi]